MSAKFKTGDTVQAVEAIGNDFIHQGLTGTVQEDSVFPYVKWNDRKIGTYAVSEDSLRIFEPETVQYDVYHYDN